MVVKSAPDAARRAVQFFVGGGVVLLVTVLTVLALRQGWFDQYVTLVFEARRAEALRQGMVVRLSGIPVGKVARVELNDRARVDVTLQINARYQHFLRSDARALLAQEGLIGDHYINLLFDQQGPRDRYAPLHDGDPISYAEGTSIGELVTQLGDRVFPLLEEMQQLVRGLRDPEGGLQGTLREARALLRDLRATRGQLLAAMASVRQLADTRAPATLDQVDASLKAYAELAQHTDQRLERLIQTLDATLATYRGTGQQAGAASDEVRKLVESLRPQLQETLQNIDLLSRRSRQTLENMQTHWPFTGDAPLDPPPPPAKP